MTMRRALVLTALFPIVVWGCSGEKAQPDKAAVSKQVAAAATNSVDPCSLLTAQEIKSAAGWAPDSSKPKTYGSTGDCTWFGPTMTQNVALLIGQGMPNMSSSRAMADWRAEQYKGYKVNDAIVEPIEGLGVPAIRNEWGLVGIEMAVGGQLVTLSGLSLKFDEAKKLATLVLARMKK